MLLFLQEKKSFFMYEKRGKTKGVAKKKQKKTKKTLEQAFLYVIFLYRQFLFYFRM